MARIVLGASSLFRASEFIVSNLQSRRWMLPEVLRPSQSHIHSKYQLLFSRSVVSDSLRPHGLHHARPPCPSPLPEVTQTHVH